MHFIGTGSDTGSGTGSGTGRGGPGRRTVRLPGNRGRGTEVERRQVLRQRDESRRSAEAGGVGNSLVNTKSLSVGHNRGRGGLTSTTWLVGAGMSSTLVQLKQKQQTTIVTGLQQRHKQRHTLCKLLNLNKLSKLLKLLELKRS